MVAGAVETVLAMGTIMVVTVFFVAMVAFPDAIHAQTG